MSRLACLTAAAVLCGLHRVHGQGHAYVYGGCRKNKALMELSSRTLISVNPNTVQSCANFCGRARLPYAGVVHIGSNMHECSCDTRYGKNDLRRASIEVDDSYCDARCDDNLSCGAEDRTANYYSLYFINGAVALTPAPPPTPTPPTPIPRTAIPATPTPPTPIPQTAIPATPTPPTPIPQTAIPATPTPPTPIPQTAIPATPSPPTPIPQTAIPATPNPPTPIPLSPIPTTAQTAMPGTMVPPSILLTVAPPTPSPPSATLPPTLIPTPPLPPPTAAPLSLVTVVPSASPAPQTAVTLIPQLTPPIATPPTAQPAASTPQPARASASTRRPAAVTQAPPAFAPEHTSKPTPTNAPHTTNAHPADTHSPDSLTPPTPPLLRNAAVISANVQETVAKVGGVAALGALLGSSPGAAMRLVLVSGPCEKARGEGYPWPLHPTQLDLSGSEEMGMVVGNTLVCVAAGVVAYLLVRAVSQIGSFVNPAFQDEVDAQGVLRVPSAPLFVFAFLYQGICVGALVLVINNGEGAMGSVVGALGAGMCVVVPYKVLRSISAAVPAKAQYHMDWERLHPAVLFLVGPGDWVSTSLTTDWSRRWQTVIRGYKTDFAWYGVFDALSAFALSAIKAVETQSGAQCGYTKFFAALVFAMLFVLELRLAPSCRYRDHYMLMAVHLQQATAMVLLGGGYVEAASAAEADAGTYAAPWETEAAEVLTMVVVILLILKMVFDAAASVLSICQGRKGRLQQDFLSRRIPDADGPNPVDEMEMLRPPVPREDSVSEEWAGETLPRFGTAEFSVSGQPGEVLEVMTSREAQGLPRQRSRAHTRHRGRTYQSKFPGLQVTTSFYEGDEGDAFMTPRSQCATPPPRAYEGSLLGRPRLDASGSGSMTNLSPASSHSAWQSPSPRRQSIARSRASKNSKVKLFANRPRSESALPALGQPPHPFSKSLSLSGPLPPARRPIPRGSSHNTIAPK
eukprot:TRINITY_DN1815_c1_g1_i12.p1 TRINITY_DN1815_c1_g1~~TRINITY_DN1815_c1_g1_i12.p1  ORF type:complete len:968 (+),score=123.12 TRINITY_DN1815_c1_g1_i12:55-2958(+)